MKTEAPDTRPRFLQAVHVDDLSNPKRPKIETRHRESIIAPGKRIEASDRTYYTDAAGSLRRVHREGDQVSIVSRRSNAKPATKAQQKSAARIEAKIAKREARSAGRKGVARIEPVRFDVTEIGHALGVLGARALTGDPYQDRKRQEGEPEDVRNRTDLIRRARTLANLKDLKEVE